MFIPSFLELSYPDLTDRRVATLNEVRVIMKEVEIAVIKGNKYNLSMILEIKEPVLLTDTECIVSSNNKNDQE